MAEVKGKDYTEEMLAWLEALEIPIEKTFEREELANYLRPLLTAATGEGRDNQFKALWEATQFKWEKILPVGVSPFSIRFRTGKQLRFSIKGRRGAFGLTGVLRNTGFDLQEEWDSFVI